MNHSDQHLKAVSSGDQDGPPTHRTMPLSVDATLQYSPLSSIAPFGPDPVPLPVIFNADASSLFTDTRQHHAARRLLEHFSQETDSALSDASTISAVTHRIQQLLGSCDLSKYEFKNTADSRHHVRAKTMSDPYGGSVSSTPAGLGSFSGRVFNSTDITLRYRTPHSPSRSVIKYEQTDRLGGSKPPSDHKALNVNGISEGEPDSLRSISDQRRTEPVVLVPQLSPSQRNDYEAYDFSLTSNEAEQLKGKQSRSQVDRLSIHMTAQYDQQKEAIEAALHRFLTLLAEIFEADDQLQPDTSGVYQSTAGEHFIAAHTSEETGFLLAPKSLADLESLLGKIIPHHSFARVPFEKILRLQKLCETSLRAAEALEPAVSMFSNEEEVADVWLEKVKIIDVGLRATRLLLMIVSGGREERQIYSEETLQSILNVLKMVFDGLITPVIEIRNTGSRSQLFQRLAPHKQPIVAVFGQSIKTLHLLANILTCEALTESAITTIEFLSMSLIFVENAYSDRDSIPGVQRCEHLRVVAMDILVQAFSYFTDHRAFLIDEILTSLEKLPITRQKARQYKLADGKTIQLVSALIMKLVQSNPMLSKRDLSLNGRRRLFALHGPQEEDRSSNNSHTGPEETPNREEFNDEPESVLRQLSDLASPPLEAAQKSAQYVIQFLVSRALKSTKTGDDPYRTLLDIFAEDFLAVVESSLWPASELLLRCLLTNMIGLVATEKSTAPAKNMALDLLGLMGAALSDILSQLRRNCKCLEGNDSGLNSHLLELAESFLSGELQEIDLLALDGPYPLVLGHVGESDTADRQLQSDKRFHAVQWATRICAAYEATTEDDDDPKTNADMLRLAITAKDILTQGSQLDIDEPITNARMRMAYSLIVLNMPFGKAFEKILILLLNSLNSDQATVRSKGLKSVIHIIEKDPTIMDRGSYVMQQILNRTSDQSPLVRDSALGLITRCIQLRPALDGMVLDCILARASDSQVGVRKRAMKLMRDIYLRNAQKDARSGIADALLHRSIDTDEGVSELAKQLLEEVWIAPLVSIGKQGSEIVQRSLAIKEQASLIVSTVQRGGGLNIILGTFLRSILGEASKNTSCNVQICKELVNALFDDVLEHDSQHQKSWRQAVMQTLTVFARAKPGLFGAEQLEHLQVYVEHLSHNDDLNLFRSVVVIFREVLPQLPNVKAKFLAAVQKALLESLTKLGKRELNEVVACLWTINRVMQTTDRLSKVTISCIKAIQSFKMVDGQEDAPKRQVTSVIRYMNIAGLFVKYGDFTGEIPRFRAELPWWKGESVPALLIDLVAPFTKTNKPIAIRTAALDGIGAVCQAWPQLYLKDQVLTAFDIVFNDTLLDLQNLVIVGIKDYLAVEEKRSEVGSEPSKQPAAGTNSGRLAGVLAATQNDGVATSLAQRYLKYIIQIATATNELAALNATEVIGSINRQGLVHPRDCVAVLVALETSKNPTIAKIASREHRFLHQKHETIVRKEYMKAVQQTFLYQQKVALNFRGATGCPLVSKLQHLFEVVKTSKSKIRRNFLGSLCSKMIDVDPAKLDISDDPPHPLQMAIFTTENLAFFEYGTVDEVVHVIACLERLVSTIGATVVQVLETEGGFVSSLSGSKSPPAAESQPAILPLSSTRMRQFIVVSTILSSAWDTRSYLCRLYGLGSSSKNSENKSKASAKDLSKPPAKHPGVNGQLLWDVNGDRMAVLADDMTMATQSQRFVEFMSVDEDFKTAAEKDDRPEVERAQSSTDDDRDGRATSEMKGNKSRKRKARRPSVGQGAKKRRGSSSVKRAASDFTSDSESRN